MIGTVLVVAGITVMLLAVVAWELVAFAARVMRLAPVPSGGWHTDLCASCGEAPEHCTCESCARCMAIVYTTEDQPA